MTHAHDAGVAAVRPYVRCQTTTVPFGLGNQASDGRPICTEAPRQLPNPPPTTAISIPGPPAPRSAGPTLIRYQPRHVANLPVHDPTAPAIYSTQRQRGDSTLAFFCLAFVDLFLSRVPLAFLFLPHTHRSPPPSPRPPRSRDEGVRAVPTPHRNRITSHTACSHRPSALPRSRPPDRWYLRARLRPHLPPSTGIGSGGVFPPSLRKGECTLSLSPQVRTGLASSLLALGFHHGRVLWVGDGGLVPPVLLLRGVQFDSGSRSCYLGRIEVGWGWRGRFHVPVWGFRFASGKVCSRRMFVVKVAILGAIR